MNGPGSATRSLMHDDVATTIRYYIDSSLLDPPPELFTPWG